MAILEIKIQGEIIDLFDNEKIVQSFSIINIEDITQRESEYSNTFKVPKTNRNLTILGYIDFLNVNSSVPYSKINCEIFIDGFFFKKGFVSIENIDEDISLRFFTGNATFYEIIKNKSINQISSTQTTSLKTIWNLSNVISLRTANEGIFFPLIDYNGMPTNTTNVDVRLLLPSFYRKTLIQALVEDAGYILQNNIENSLQAYNTDILPTSKNNLKNTQDTIDKNTYKGSPNDTTIYYVGSANFPEIFGISFNLNYGGKFLSFGNYISGNEENYNILQNNWGDFESYFKANVGGIYNVIVDFNLTFNHYEFWFNNGLYDDGVATVPKHKVNDTIEIWIMVNNVKTKLIKKIDNTYSNPSPIINGTGSNTFSFSDTITATYNVQANFGDLIKIAVFVNSFFYGDNDINFLGGSMISRIGTVISTNSDCEFKLSEGLAFGGEVSTENCLTDIKQSDFFKDTCIRYGLIPIIDEDKKIVKLFEFSKIKSNIQNSVNWSSKLDETKDYNLEFKIDKYGQRNILKHKEDKFVLTEPEGSTGVITINNENLELEKTLYESPFAASETVERLNGKKVIYIDSHDGVSLINSSSFKNGVTARTCYFKRQDFTVTFTDGTTNTIVSNDIPLTWFIDNSNNYSAGFQSNLLDYSIDLITILQRLKIVKCEIRLNIIDILNLNYFYPIYIDEFNSYFFLSKISQFDYTSNDSTTVELIKLN